jgi:adenine phosphoribosyltransferase
MAKDGNLRARLLAAFRAPGGGADLTRWWRDPDLLRCLPSALATLHAEPPTVVAGIEASGMLLGPLVAVQLGVGFVPVRKQQHAHTAGEKLWRRTTPPDYRDRGLDLSVRRHQLARGDRVLLVDDWIVTGAQATAVANIVRDAEATWVGAVVVVDAAPAEVRRRLNVRCLLRERELSW